MENQERFREAVCRLCDNRGHLKGPLGHFYPRREFFIPKHKI